MPSARARSRPSAKLAVIIASTAGEAIAPPTPCAARAASSQPADCARPPASEATVNKPMPAQEHPAPAEDVTGAAAEQQQAAERQRVGVQHPGQAGRGEVQAVGDARQGDVHHGHVENDHQLGAQDDRQGQAPAVPQRGPAAEAPAGFLHDRRGRHEFLSRDELQVRGRGNEHRPGSRWLSCNRSQPPLTIRRPPPFRKLIYAGQVRADERDRYPGAGAGAAADAGRRPAQLRPAA